jgi:hypothetical protein
MSESRRNRGFFKQLFGRRTPPRRRNVKLLILVEGQHDVAFLTGISSILHRDNQHLPDLGALEPAGEVIFLPIGGGDVIAWASRLAPVGLPELHIFDREAPPETEKRQQAARIVNERANCKAFVTMKRSLENYLHPQCLLEARGIEIDFGDDDNVPELVAEGSYQRSAGQPAWSDLTGRARKRCRERTKRWLNRTAVDRMTPARLTERDPACDVRSWLLAVAELSKR